MKGIVKIAIIGTGNAGSYLSHAFAGKDLLVQSFGRKPGDTENPHSEVYLHPEHFDLILLCVSDHAIAEVSEAITTTDTLIAHVSGATPLSAIAKKHKHRGVFYPLMSLKGQSEIDPPTIPFCLEANDEQSLGILKKLAKTLGAQWSAVNSEERTYLHLAAVLAHNFSNHLHYQASEVMKEAGLDFRILLPLLENALKNLHHSNPKDMQTGPAMRNDEETIARHLDLLKDPAATDIYKLFTQSIRETYDKKL